MKNIIMTGGNGMVGRLVLELCLGRADVARVTSIVRRTTGIRHEKLVEVIHDDFLDYSPIGTHLENQDVCFYCLGVYTGQVPTPAFKRITVEFTRAFGQALRLHNDNLTFCFLSGAGADSSEKSRILFAREKGIAENLLLGLQFRRTHIFRPGYIYPVTPRQEPNFGYKLMRALYNPVARLYPNIGVTSVQLAATIVNTGLDGGEAIVYENKDIRTHT